MKITFPQLFVKKPHRKPISCKICLIVHGTVLLHAKHQNLIAQSADSLTPSELAEAARRLLPKATKLQGIALALPSTEFVATTIKLPAVYAQNLKKIVNLQKTTLLPGVTEPLLLAVQAPASGEHICALWLPVKIADELFQAFDKVGLFLKCILPRPVVVLPKTTSYYKVYDEDDSTITCLEWSGGVIQRWLHISKEDSDVPEFQRQLGNTLSTFNNDVIRKTSVSDWQGQSIPSPVAYSYAFIPPRAELRMTQAARQKNMRHIMVAVAFVIFGIIGSILFAIDYEKNLKLRMEDLKDSTKTASKFRAEVSEIEELIGPVKKFPRQDTILIFETLQKLIPKHSWITNFHIEWGLIKFEGYSPNPSEIIEILTKEPNISNVEQTRGTFSERGKKELKFGISFKLKDFELESYWEEYFSQSPL